MPAHLKCEKQWRGIKQGESWEAMNPSTCVRCNLPIQEGDTVVRPGADERTPNAPLEQAGPLTTENLVKVLLPQIIKGVTGLLPDLLRDLADKHVESMCAAAFQRAGAPTRIQIPNLPVIDAGHQHRNFPLLLKALVAGCNAWLAGPSGSGKTTAAMNVAKALQTPFRYTGAIGDPYGLLGFRTATGEVVRTPFRDAWETGGIFLWDEVDASDPNALLAFNAALANSSCAFPDATVPRHPGCLIIAAANTWGHGATNEYVGRNKIDAAFLKRFVFLDWPYDEDLERNTCSNKEWCAKVQQVRKNVASAKLRVLITPRETYQGERLLAAGCSQEETERMTIRAGLSDEQWRKIAPLPEVPGVQKTDWSGMTGSTTGRKPRNNPLDW